MSGPERAFRAATPGVSWIYAGATYLLEPMAAPLLAILARNEAEEHRSERLARIRPAPVDSWWHAASLGEVAALEPVLLQAESRELCGRFAVTTTTLAGREAAGRRWPGRASLAPIDLPRTIARSLDARSPGAIILVETELWPNWIRLALRRGIRVAVVNGRISDRTWPRYRRWSPVSPATLSGIAAVSARSDRDAERFLALGVRAKAVRVTGNTKHDRTPSGETAQLPWVGKRLWTAGSVRPGEERPVLAAFEALRRRHPDLRLALVPRHPEEWPELVPGLLLRGLRVAVRSRPDGADREAEVLVVDTRGELGSFYAASTVVFVGGTLVPVGGHNVMEAAAAGVPVVVGPHHDVVVEEVQELERASALRVVRNSGDLESVLDTWLRDPSAAASAGRRAAETASGARGAAGRTLEWLVERGVLPAKGRHG